MKILEKDEERAMDTSSPQNKMSAYFYDILKQLSSIHLRFLLMAYLLAYVGIELLVQNTVQLYIFTVFLSLSGIYFSWLAGGRETMWYVAFFNSFIVFIFSKMFWNQNIIVTGTVFKSKSFFIMYGLIAVFVLVLLRMTSPSDARRREQQEAIENERKHRENLEFFVASRKLKNDLLAQANLVKDELQLIEGAWRSNIHNIINDLPPVKEQEIYQQLILPFQDNIIKHLRELETSLTFDIKSVTLAELREFISWQLNTNKKVQHRDVHIELIDHEWQSQQLSVNVDKNKLWEMLQNLYRNSQTALDLKRIDLLRKKQGTSVYPRISVCLKINHNQDAPWAEINVTDNGGGISEEYLADLFKNPVPSKKRGGKSSGEGTLFVKFFADRMHIRIAAENVDELADSGLSVKLMIPIIT